MARPVRVELEDAVYHVTARANERKDIIATQPTANVSSKPSKKPSNGSASSSMPKPDRG